MDILHPANLLMGVLGIGLLVLKLWALVDCATRPQAAFELHGKLSKVIWLVILGLAVLLGATDVIGLFGIAGTIAAIVYLVDVRPAVSGKAF